MYVTCKRCGVGFDDIEQIACVRPEDWEREEDGEEFIWSCVECLKAGDVVAWRNECPS